MVPNPTTCPHCGSPDLAEERTPDGPHWAKLTCRDCGRMAKWLPRPRVSWRSLRLPAGPDVAAGEGLPELVGPSEAQVGYAESVRRPLLKRVWALGGEHHALALAMATITHAGWWIAAEKAGDLDAIAWPASWLPETPED